LFMGNKKFVCGRHLYFKGLMKGASQLYRLRNQRLKRIEFTCLREPLMDGKFRLSILAAKFKLTRGSESRILGKITSPVIQAKKEDLTQRPIVFEQKAARKIIVKSARGVIRVITFMDDFNNTISSVGSGDNHADAELVEEYCVPNGYHLIGLEVIADGVSLERSIRFIAFKSD
jgi:hypothetical protein